MKDTTNGHWLSLTHQVGKQFASRAEAHDINATFVSDNYDTLRASNFFSATIPEEFGGGGVQYSEMCEIVRIMAHYCSSTALAFSMHQHLVAAVIWRCIRGQGGEELLKKIVANQTILVSTGARDWLESNGEVERMTGGYLVTAQKSFASQSATGDILVTSAPFHDPEQGWQVLHFPVPLKSDGVTILDDWYTLGMRASGSHSVKLQRVFIPESAVTLRRPRGEFHPVWNVILTVAMPLIMAVYVGIAQKAASLAIEFAKRQDKVRRHVPMLLGAMNNDLVSAELHWQDMVRIANNYNFEAVDHIGQEILSRKTNTANASIAVVEKAMEIVGGRGFYRSFGLERLFRDVQAARYHPLQEKDQFQFSGEFLLRN